MTKRRISLYLAVLMVFILMTSLTSAFAAPLALYATLEGESHQYTGTVGTYATLEISVNNSASRYGAVMREIILDLPASVSIQSISSGKLSGNKITGWSGSTISVELFLRPAGFQSRTRYSDKAVSVMP